MNKFLPFVLLVAITACKPSRSAEHSQSTAQLYNTYWKLMEAHGKTIKVPENSREPYMVLANADQETRLQGFAGCNGLGGNYSVQGDQIDFTVITTKMYCEQTMDTENLFVRVLEEADRYVIRGETLHLYQGKNKVASFESVYLR